MTAWIRKNRFLLGFLGKTLLIYTAWYVAYDHYLLPDGRLDAWLSKNVAFVSGTVFEMVGVPMVVNELVVRFPEMAGVFIANGCNGISTIGLFMGFVLAFPGEWSRRLFFVPFGVGVIYVTNIARIVAMLLAQHYYPPAFDILHGFALTGIFYVVVFVLWMVWANVGGSRA